MRAYISEALENLAQAERRHAPGHTERATISSRPTCYAPSSRAVPPPSSSHNPPSNRDAAKRLFHLNDTHVDRIATLRPRQQVLLKRPDVAKVLTLDVDRQSYWLYTNTPPDNERLQAVAARHGAGCGSGHPCCGVGARHASTTSRGALLVACAVTAEAQTAREVTYTPRAVVPVHAKLRFTTMIILPAGEQILDFVCGDKDFWIVSGAENLAYVKPAKAGAQTESESGDGHGQVYSFLLTEGGAEHDLTLYVVPETSATTSTTGEQRFYSAAAGRGLPHRGRASRAGGRDARIAGGEGNRGRHQRVSGVVSHGTPVSVSLQGARWSVPGVRDLSRRALYLYPLRGHRAPVSL